MNTAKVTQWCFYTGRNGKKVQEITREASREYRDWFLGIEYKYLEVYNGHAMERAYPLTFIVEDVDEINEWSVLSIRTVLNSIYKYLRGWGLLFLYITRIKQRTVNITSREETYHHERNA